MTGSARAACVIGWPIEHSRSPLIHNYWLKRYSIAGGYRTEAVRPEQFRDFVQSLAERGYVGANVTVPHKEAALAFTSGYVSNQAGFSTIASLIPDCLILSDALHHNSMIEGVGQSGMEK